MAPDNMTDEIKRALGCGLLPRDLSGCCVRCTAASRGLPRGLATWKPSRALRLRPSLGGGSRDVVLNQMTADALNLPYTQARRRVLRWAT